MQEFDVVVIGTGEAGSNVAYACRERGWRVAIVDERPFGGTCKLRGCDPKKVLVGAAQVADLARRFALLGILTASPNLDWPALMRFKHRFTDPVPEQQRAAFEQAGIVAYRAHARFTDVHTLVVGEEPVTARYFAIATGSKPMPIAKGDDLLLTSTDFLDLERLPASLLFVGGGFISMEFAHVAVRAGARVQIVDILPRPLSNFDPDLVDLLVDYSRRLGIEFHLKSSVRSIERGGDGVIVSAESEGIERSLTAEAAVHGAGRIADLDELNLEAAGVERTKRGVAVNEFLQSRSTSNVYAAGDAADAGGAPLTPVAAYEGAIVASNILDGNHLTPDFRGLASIVYTIPSLASVGLREQEARARGIDFDVKTGDMSQWYTSRRLDEPLAHFKVLVERNTDRIVGGHIVGAHAEEQINVLSLAIRAGVKAGELEEVLFGYPTGASDLQYMV